MANTASVRSTSVQLPVFDLRSLQIRLIGDAPLICHAWSKKAKSEMLAKQMKKAKEAKEAKDPERDFRESLYPLPGGGYGFPAVAFKAAAVDACSHVEGITKVEARGTFHIDDDLLPIAGVPTPREDMVRIGTGTADIRYRGEFLKWSVDIPIRYNAGVLSAEQIIHLFNIAGFAIGVGEWRPQRDGQFGRFHVATQADSGEAVSLRTAALKTATKPRVIARKGAK